MTELISKEFALDWKKVEEGLLVFDVPVMSLLGMDERPDFDLPIDLDADWFRRAIKTFEDLKITGKLPRLLRRHNHQQLEADVIGRLLNLRWEEPWLKADALVTEPEAQEQVLRGELPSLSAEFDPRRAYVWGLSLIGGEEGHFDRELPDLLLKEEEVGEKKLAKIPEERRSLLLAGTMKLMEEEMTDKEKRDKVFADKKKADAKAAAKKKKLEEHKPVEDIAALTEAFMSFKDEVMARLDNLEAEVEVETPATEEETETETETEEAKAKAKKKTAEKDTLKRLTKLETDVKVGGMVLRLRGNRHPMKDSELHKKLSECKSDEAREERFQRLLAQPGVPTDELPEENDETEEKEEKEDAATKSLGKMYDKRIKSGVKLKSTREEYIKANHMFEKARLDSKKSA